MPRIRAEKDFYAGLIYAALAIGFLVYGRDFPIGSASRMGPGYFPRALGMLMLGFGVISIVRSFLQDGPPLQDIAWRKVALITASIVLFGATIGPLGLVFALPLMVVVAALASAESRYDLQGLLILGGLTVFCIVVFVKGLGVPMPIFGSLFDGLVPAWLQR